jgi:uncharacterized protein YegJ (DUF2314 family)
MKPIIYSLFIAIMFINCNGRKLEKVRDSDIYQTDDSDLKMNNAILESRRSFSEFEKAFNSKDSTISGFAIKYPFTKDDNSGNEHIWLSYVTFENGNYYGFIDNTPEFTKRVKEGDKIQINLENISDWNYMKNDTIFGGYTIKVVKDALSENEKEAFNNSLGGKILK